MNIYIFPRKNLHVLFIALLMPYLAASAELLYRRSCSAIAACSPILLYGLIILALSLSLKKADLNVLDFVVNRFFMKLFRTNNIGTVKECQLYFSFQLPSEMLKQRTKRFDMKFKRLSASWL